MHCLGRHKPPCYRTPVLGQISMSGHGAHVRRRIAPRVARRDRLFAGLLMVGLFSVYLAVSRREYVAYDASSMEAVGQNLVNHFTLRTTGASTTISTSVPPILPTGSASACLLSPYTRLSKVTGHTMALLSLINPLVTATTGVVIYAIGRELRWKSALALLAATAFGLLTMALWSTTELFSEPSVGLCLAILVWAVLRWRNGWKRAPLVVGIAATVPSNFGLIRSSRSGSALSPPPVRAVAGDLAAPEHDASRLSPCFPAWHSWGGTTSCVSAV